MADLPDMAKGLPETERVYWVDSRARTAEAKVLKLFKDKGCVYVVTDRTNLYPQGGDQPSDTGKLYSASAEMTIRKALLRKGVIFHWGKVESGELHEGDAVTIEPYWPTRQRNTRMHSLAHLLRSAMEQANPEIRITDALLAPPAWLQFQGDLSEEQVRKVGEIAHNAIMEDRQVKIGFVGREEAGKRCRNLPENLPGTNLRMVEIDGFGPIPCSGTHVEHLAEIGDFKIIKLEEREKGKVLIFDLCGKE